MSDHQIHIFTCSLYLYLRKNKHKLISYIRLNFVFKSDFLILIFFPFFDEIEIMEKLITLLERYFFSNSWTIVFNSVMLKEKDREYNCLSFFFFFYIYHFIGLRSLMELDIKIYEIFLFFKSIFFKLFLFLLTCQNYYLRWIVEPFPPLSSTWNPRFLPSSCSSGPGSRAWWCPWYPSGSPWCPAARPSCWRCYCSGSRGCLSTPF